jgi:aminopeptidase N
MKIKHSIASLFFMTAVLYGYPQEKTVTYIADPNAIPPDLPVALHHVAGKITLQPEKYLVTGDVTFTLTANRVGPDSIVFSAPDFTVKSVTLGNAVCKYHQNGTDLVIIPPFTLQKGPEYSLEIKYDARPMAGPIYFIGWQPWEKGKRKQIWAHRPGGWLPYMDARVTMDMEITFDGQFNVFTNGERVGVTENPDKTKTWHYRMTRSHPFFSTALAIGDYEFKQSQTSRGVPLELLYYKGMADRVPTTYKYTEQMFDFFEQETGVPYPYPVYREIPVIDYMYGGMETTTSTIFGDYMLIDPRAYWQRNYINVNAHELAHQWYGDCIAHFVNRDVWLTESFGTYYAKMFEKSVFGEDYYENIMNNEAQTAFAASAQNNYPVGGSQGGVARIYQKGSLVLGMLRYVMGEKQFKDAIKLYTERYLFKNPETNDFIRCTYDATGKPCNWFFDEWILRGGEPSYEVSYLAGPDSAGIYGTTISVAQVQEATPLIPLFRMPFVLEVRYTDGSSDTVMVWVENKSHIFRIPNRDRKAIDFVLFDPGKQVLKKTKFDKSLRELKAQALRAGHMIDRYDAIMALDSFPLSEKRETLVAAFANETFFLPKAAVIRQLANDDAKASKEIIAAALKDKDAIVRQAALYTQLPVEPENLPVVEAALFDSSYLNAELALKILCKSYPSKASYYLDKTKNETGWRGLNIRMAWLQIAIGAGENQYIPELIGYSGPGYEFETRMNALTALKNLDIADTTVIRNAVTASLHWNNKLAGTGREVLGYFAQQPADKDLVTAVIGGMNLTPKDLEAIEKIIHPKK